MGISINIAIQLARIAPLLKDCKSGVMLGRQAMHFRPPDWKPRLIASLETLGINTTEEEIFQDDGFCEAYLSKIGWPKMESLDFSDIEGAEYIHDLSYPINENLEQRFDLIYDGGTTEHVFDIASAFRNVDAMLKDGGIFVSCVGADGWFGHGFYQIGPDIPCACSPLSMRATNLHYIQPISCETYQTASPLKTRAISTKQISQRDQSTAIIMPFMHIFFVFI